MELATAHLAPQLFAIVPGNDSHHAFVRTSWRRSYARSEFARSMRPGVFMRCQDVLMDRLLRQYALRIAIPADDPAFYLGWSLGNADLLHYVYVKPDFRGMGIATRLLEEVNPACYTHLTQDWKPISRRHDWTYCPHLIGAT